MSTKTTRSGRSVKRPAKLISEDDGNNEEPMSNLTTKKPVKPLTKKKEQVSQDYENPNELPNPVVKSSRRPLRTLKNSQKDKTAVEASKPSKTDRRLTKEIKENSHNDEKPKDDVDKEMENIFGLNSPHEKEDNNLAIESSKTDDDDSKEMPKKVGKPSRKPVQKEDEKSQLPINDRPRRQMKRKISENEDSEEKIEGTTKKKPNNKALKTDEIAQMLNSDDDEEVEVAPAKKRATTKKVQKQMVSTSCTAETVLKHGTENSLKTDEIAQMLNDDEEEEGKVPSKKRATRKKVQKPMVSTSCTAETVLKHGNEDSLKTDEIAQMLNDEEEVGEVPAKKRATRKKVQKQMVEEPKNDKKDQDSEDNEVSFKEGLFNFSRAEDVKKKPIYMRQNFSPDKKHKIKPADVFDDVYDILDSSSQDDPNAKKKKKKRAPAKRKQKAGMILAFDSNKTQVANVVKKIMNVQSAKKVKERPKRNLNLKGAETKKSAVPEKKNPEMLHEAVAISQPDIILNPVPSTSKHLQETETSRILPAYTSNLQVASPGIMNFETGEDNNIVSDITPQIPENDHQNSSNHNSAEKNDKKEYKTPVIQKNISKLVQLRKASTPRLEEAPPPKETKENLIKKCFGFDTDSSGCDSDTNISNVANTTRNSLAGFSPVKSTRPNNNLLITPAPYKKTCDKTTKVKPYSGPWLPPSLLAPASQVQPPPTTKPMRFAPRMQFKKPNPTSTNVSNSSRSRHFSKPTKKPTQISSSSVPEMEVSVFDDLKDEITRPDVEANTDTGRNQLEENPDTVDKQENKEIAEQPEKNAFEALKKPRNRKNEKQKPLKTVTNTRSTPAVTKTKQPKIYDESNGRKSLAGTKKIEMSDVATNEEEDENGIRLQMKPVKSYTRAKPINTSITASPPKKMKKKEKEEKAWVSKNKSHFNDIDDFDLSFD